MPKVKIVIKGPSEDAQFRCEGSNVALSRTGRTYRGSVRLESGKQKYVIIVYGAEGEKWTATVESPTATNEHAGHMSDEGFDTSGTTPIQV